MRAPYRYIILALLIVVTVVNTYGQMMENLIYTPPGIPKTITTQSDRLAYMVRNFWGNYDFSNRALIENRRYSEGAYKEFFNLVKLLSDEEFMVANITLLKHASANVEMTRYFVSMGEKYIYRGDSLNIAKERYLPLLNHYTKIKSLSNSDRERYKERLREFTSNQVVEPTIAPDIEFTKPNLRSDNLYSLRNDYLLLLILESDTLKTAQLQKSITADSLLLAHHNVEVVAIHRNDNDVEGWLTQPHVEWWTNGYDDTESVNESQLYNRSKSTTMLLLDHRKRVVKEDRSIEKILNHLKQLGLPPVAVEEAATATEQVIGGEEARE